jgi:hypothetical protein
MGIGTSQVRLLLLIYTILSIVAASPAECRFTSEFTPEQIW